MAAAGHLTAMAAEGELLQEIGGGLARRQEAHFHLASLRDVGYAADEPKRLGDALTQINVYGALSTGPRKRSGALKGGAERIEANGYRRRAWLVRGEDASDHIQQQVDLELDAEEVRSMG